MSTPLSQIDGANSDWYDLILSPCRTDGALWHRKLEGFMWIVAVQNKPSPVITLNQKHSTRPAKKMNWRLIKSTLAVDSVMRLRTLGFMAQIKITRNDFFFSRLNRWSLNENLSNVINGRNAGVEDPFPGWPPSENRFANNDAICAEVGWLSRWFTSGLAFLYVEPLIRLPLWTRHLG